MQPRINSRANEMEIIMSQPTEHETALARILQGAGYGLDFCQPVEIWQERKPCFEEIKKQNYYSPSK